MKIIVWYESILISLRHLLKHPLRTVLTILGFTVSLASLLAMVGIGEGTRQKVINQMELLGSGRIISVQVDKQIMNDPAYVIGMENKLNQTDIDAIARTSSHISRIVPVTYQIVNFQNGDNQFKGQFLGTTKDYFSIYGWKLQSGRTFNDIDTRKKNRVCVIGAEVKRQLFGALSPIGRKLHFNGDEYTIIGVLARVNFQVHKMINEMVIVPIGLQAPNINELKFSEILTQIDTIDHIPIIQQQITQMLTDKHGGFEFFKIQSQKEFIETLSQSSALMGFTFSIISCIILFVGGIGIMNLLLVSVTERTKEIGVYKAVGAKDNDIFRLFLIEAVIMSCLGGIVGIIFGVSGSRFIAKLTEIILNNKIESIISVNILILALIASILLGIFFGLYPALNASRIDPGKALRYE